MADDRDADRVTLPFFWRLVLVTGALLERRGRLAAFLLACLAVTVPLRAQGFAPRDATIIFTLTDGPGADPQLTVSRNSRSPFGHSFSTTSTFAATMANEPLTSSGSTSSAVFVPAPTPTATPTVLTRNNTYVVQPGDTIPKIAALVGMWPSVVAHMNGVPSGNIWPGQVIQFRTYTVLPGDTFFSVASKLATTRAALLAANPGVNPDALRHGQVLNVP